MFLLRSLSMFALFVSLYSDLSQHVVSDCKQAMDLLEEGIANRITAATHNHDASSRSHAIFTIQYTQVTISPSPPCPLCSHTALLIWWWSFCRFHYDFSCLFTTGNPRKQPSVWNFQQDKPGGLGWEVKLFFLSVLFFISTSFQSK